eukprot:TRINITY_DN409_c0_g2_i3.p2 TRINITY_DN409_c0_g2~~TRINITY_DN409_c0_g2_i3.p2  ORF type:complete len:307 (+),score=84.00 TRINITY_DN409_c0_g2_i3:87-923(+)
MSQHADATAGTVKVTVYGGDAPPYHSSNFVSIGGGPEQSDAGREVVHTFTAHTAPGEGLVKWEVVKAPRGKGNWLRPAGEQDPPGGGTPKLLGSFWARRLPPMHDCPAGSVYVRYRHAPVGSFLHRKDPDPSTSVGPSCYIDDAWRLLYALAPASIPEGGREEAAAAAAAAASDRSARQGPPEVVGAAPPVEVTLGGVRAPLSSVAPRSSQPPTRELLREGTPDMWLSASAMVPISPAPSSQAQRLFPQKPRSPRRSPRRPPGTAQSTAATHESPWRL